MTSVREQRIHTIEVDAEDAEGVRTAIAALRRYDQLVGEPRVVNGRLMVDVKARPVPRPRVTQKLRLEVPLVVKITAGSLPFAGVGGWVAGVQGADVIGQVVGTLGSAGAVALLLYALATVRHRAPDHHCPGCPNH